jgi:Ca2+-binding RTX toxin-like protein
MSTSSFSDYLFDQTGLIIGTSTITQNQFSVNYTAWLTSILTDDAAEWLNEQLGDIGTFSVKLNQNDPDGAPYVEYLDANLVLQTFSLVDLFGDDPDAITLKTGKTTQERYFFDTFTVPDTDVNDAPTDIHLTIDPSFAAAATGVAGKATLEGNNEVSSTGALLVGILTASDPDVGDTHDFTIIDGNIGDQFEIKNGNELWLVGDNTISVGENFDLKFEVADQDGATYFETFSIQTGTSDKNTISGDDQDGTGETALDPVVGDDIIFAFADNDVINTNSDIIIQGTSGDDMLFGGHGADKLFGGDGNDQLFGGLQGDQLTGGAGDDLLSGNDGDDTFAFSLGGDAGDDTIADFARNEDKLSFSDVIDTGVVGLDFNDVDAAVSSFANGGAGGDVTVNFSNGASITLIGMGSAGTIDSVADLVDATSQIIVT